MCLYWPTMVLWMTCSSTFSLVILVHEDDQPLWFTIFPSLNPARWHSLLIVGQIVLMPNGQSSHHWCSGQQTNVYLKEPNGTSLSIWILVHINHFWMMKFTRETSLISLTFDIICKLQTLDTITVDTNNDLWVESRSPKMFVLLPSTQS